jgi:hypothetical protein
MCGARLLVQRNILGEVTLKNCYDYIPENNVT